MKFPHLTLLSIFTAAAGAFAQMPSFAYSNPIKVPDGVRDPQITIVGEKYFMAGTSAPFFEKDGQNPGVRLWSSADLLHWKDEGIMIKPEPDRWYHRWFWAPELFPYKGKFYLTWSCGVKGANGRDHCAIGLAVADKPTGPYTVISKDAPLYDDANDASLFLDEDGKTYLIVNRRFAPVDLSSGKVLAPLQPFFKGPGQNWWEGGLEGFSAFKRNGTYYLFYSSFARGYEVGYATAPAFTGPWTRYAKNPIYGAQSRETCARYKKEYTQAPDVPFDEVAHGSPFFGPDRRFWFSCHGIQPKSGKIKGPNLMLAPIDFDAAGVASMKLTWTPQTVPIPAAKPDPAWRDAGNPANNR